MGEPRCYFPGECPRLDRTDHPEGATFVDDDGVLWCHYCPLALSDIGRSREL